MTVKEQNYLNEFIRKRVGEMEPKEDELNDDAQVEELDQTNTKLKMQET